MSSHPLLHSSSSSQHWTSSTIPAVEPQVCAIGSETTLALALSVLAYNLTRVMNILGIRPLIAAIRA